VTVFDYGAAGATGAYIVMELVRGCTLRAQLERPGRVPPLTAAHWFEQICAAVAAAHRQRIVHRDLKPENVLIRRRCGRVDQSARFSASRRSRRSMRRTAPD
jgi:serine/threonine-protein kinase